MYSSGTTTHFEWSLHETYTGQTEADFVSGASGTASGYFPGSGINIYTQHDDTTLTRVYVVPYATQQKKLYPRGRLYQTDTEITSGISFLNLRFTNPIYSVADISNATGYMIEGLSRVTTGDTWSYSIYGVSNVSGNNTYNYTIHGLSYIDNTGVEAPMYALWPFEGASNQNTIDVMRGIELFKYTSNSASITSGVINSGWSLGQYVEYDTLAGALPIYDSSFAVRLWVQQADLTGGIVLDPVSVTAGADWRVDAGFIYNSGLFLRGILASGALWASLATAWPADLAWHRVIFGVRQNSGFFIKLDNNATISSGFTGILTFAKSIYDFLGQNLPSDSRIDEMAFWLNSLPTEEQWLADWNGGTGVEWTGAYKYGSHVSGVANIDVTYYSGDFGNSSLITIQDDATGIPYPSTIEISGLTGTTYKVVVSLSGFTHTYPGDTVFLLTSPSGQKCEFLKFRGSSNSVSGAIVTFDDDAATTWNGTSGGIFKPDGSATYELPSPAPSLPYGGYLSSLTGYSPNGTWSLYVYDASPGDSGVLESGWSLNICTNQIV